MVELPPEELEERQAVYGPVSLMKDMVRIEPGHVTLPRPMWMRSVLQKVYEFELRPDDVWIVTFPKCGTTWTQVSLI